MSCTIMRLLLMTCTVLLASAAAAEAAASGEGRFRHSPVILIPGDGGSQLWARLNGTKSPWYCQKTTGGANASQLLWLQMSNLVYPAVNCLAYNLMLRKQDSSSSTFTDDGSTRDNVGVDSFVPGFGTVDTIQWIGDWQLKSTAYFSTLVDHLTEAHGYIKNVTIRGAPYDFRKAPNEFGDYFQQLKALIEETYAKSGGNRIVLVAHSMGGKLGLHFLHTQSQGWKDKYIEHFVAAGGAFGGVPASLLAMLSGYSLGIPLVKPLWFRPVQRSWPSTHYLARPDTSVYPAGRALVTLPSGEAYTSANLSDLFRRAGYAEGAADFARFGRLTDVRRPPGVPTTCAFGAGVATPGELRWGTAADFPDAQPAGAADAAVDSGDGTVAAATGRICRGWARRQPRLRVRVVELAGAQHMPMLADPRFVRLVAEIATSGGG